MSQVVSYLRDALYCSEIDSPQSVKAYLSGIVERTATQFHTQVSTLEEAHALLFRLVTAHSTAAELLRVMQPPVFAVQIPLDAATVSYLTNLDEKLANVVSVPQPVGQALVHRVVKLVYNVRLALLLVLAKEKQNSVQALQRLSVNDLFALVKQANKPRSPPTKPVMTREVVASKPKVVEPQKKITKPDVQRSARTTISEGPEYAVQKVEEIKSETVPAALPKQMIIRADVKELVRLVAPLSCLDDCVDRLTRFMTPVRISQHYTDDFAFEPVASDVDIGRFSEAAFSKRTKQTFPRQRQLVGAFLWFVQQNQAELSQKLLSKPGSVAEILQSLPLKAAEAEETKLLRRVPREFQRPATQAPESRAARLRCLTALRCGGFYDAVLESPRVVELSYLEAETKKMDLRGDCLAFLEKLRGASAFLGRFKAERLLGAILQLHTLPEADLAALSEADLSGYIEGFGEVSRVDFSPGNARVLARASPALLVSLRLCGDLPVNAEESVRYCLQTGAAFLLAGENAAAGGLYELSRLAMDCEVIREPRLLAEGVWVPGLPRACEALSGADCEALFRELTGMEGMDRWVREHLAGEVAAHGGEAPGTDPLFSALQRTLPEWKVRAENALRAFLSTQLHLGYILQEYGLQGTVGKLRGLCYAAGGGFPYLAHCRAHSAASSTPPSVI